MRTRWAVVVAIGLIATGASHGGRHHDDHSGARDAKHAALCLAAAPTLIAAPGRAHSGPDGALAAPVLRHDPPARPHVPVTAADPAADRDTPGMTDATSRRSRAPPTTDSIPS